MLRRALPDAAVVALLFFLPLVMFWSQTVGGRTLLPTENLFKFEPYATDRAQVGAPAPHNELLDDLVLQNYQWKSFIRTSLEDGEVPLWNPHQFSGIPFLAAGQQSAFYPLSALYYVLPLPVAYGWFTMLNLWLAGAFMFALLRGLGTATVGGAIAGITYQLCGFLIASAVHPMILGAAAWLPLILLMAEFIIRKQSLFGRAASAPWMAVGAVALAFNVFAGHPEVTIYTLLIAGYFSLARLLWLAWTQRVQKGVGGALLAQASPAVWLLGMVTLGMGLAAVQFIPLVEFANTNWRAERADLDTVLSFAHPFRDVIMYVMPNFYGSPVQHSYYDLFAGETVQAVDAIGRPYIDWGIKNYVEGALYVGILPLALATVAVWHGLTRTRQPDAESGSHRVPYVLIFFILTLISLSFMFGLRTYVVVYALPGINQLNTAFRWVYGVTVGVAVMAGFGADLLWRTLTTEFDLRGTVRRAGRGLVVAGGALLAALLLSWVLFDLLRDLLPHVISALVGAPAAFNSPEMFYSFLFPQVLKLGVLLVLAGGVFLWAGYGRGRAHLWATFAVLLLAVDLIVAMRGFNPASDPELLDYTPDSIAWLQAQRAEEGAFRYTTLDDPTAHRSLFQANTTLRYGLDDVRGYDSIIPLGYVDYMREVQIQPQLDFNRVAPLYLDRVAGGEVDWRRLDLLNVRYIVTHSGTTLPENVSAFEQVYEDDAVRIYRNPQAVPRAFTTDTVTLENWPGDITPATITRDTGREKLLEVEVDAETWLVVSENYAPGWRAFVRPQDAPDADEQALPVERVLGQLQGVRLDAGAYTVRMVYSPQSFQVGAFASVISAALIALALGVWIWRFLTGGADDTSAVNRVARNSIAPIILNLFNRGIDFAFAFVMLRILGAADAGIYYYAIVVFVWFDIFTNFGLDVFLIREASRSRERARQFLLNTSYLRFFLVFACVPLLLGFILLRQALVDPALDQQALIAIGLLYIGLAPASISKGLTALFYAFEKAEYPAAVTTITTINKTVLQLIALLLGYGIVGLAGASIIVNVVTMGVLAWSAWRILGIGKTAPVTLEPAAESEPAPVITAKPDNPMIRRMVGESWPLMLNHFLATIFFQIDIVILEAMRGARIVGQYSVAYRWLLALNIIPAFFTQALLPVMSRQAEEDRAALARTYTLGVKLLVALAVPLAVAFTFMAEGLVLFLGGQDFMPAGAIALQIMIWSIPIGWMNSLTQYALIAVNLQRSITKAFALAVTFNIVTNIIFINQFGYRAAAVTTILSEAVLLLPFGMLLQSALGKLDWLDMVWRPAVAGAVMLVSTALLWPVTPVLALPAGSVVYLGVLWLLRPLNAAEWSLLLPLLPGRLRQMVVA